MINHFELKIFPKVEDVCRAAANIFFDLLNSDGKNTFIVPGGTTPHMFYYYLAQQVCNWKNTTLVLSDERLVREDSPESNYGMIKRKLLELIRIERSPKLINVVNGFSPDYSNQILESLNFRTRQLLPPKAAFLGIGTDGHTASLFSGFEDSLHDKETFILINRSSEKFQRISVSLKILSETPLLFFLVSGKKKKTVLKQIINASEESGQLPVQDLFKKAKGKVTILCDKSASPDQ